MSVYFSTTATSSDSPNLFVVIHCFDALLNMLLNISTMDNGSYNNDIIYKVGCSIATLYSSDINRARLRSQSLQLFDRMGDIAASIQMKLLNSGINAQNSHIFECYNDIKQFLLSI